MAATILYIAIVVIVLTWLWKQLGRARAPTEAEPTGVPDAASQLVQKDKSHSDHADLSGGSDD